MATETTNVLLVAPGEERDGIVRLFTKIGRRLLPFLMLCYVVAFLDRINIGFAQLQMKQTLPFSDATYGIGAGIFFVGYMLFEVPSNPLLERIGVRKTMLRIMFAWGIVGPLPWRSSRRPLQSYVARVTTCTEYLSKASIAGGVAFIAGLANLGPAAAPPATAFITAATGSPVYSLYLVVVLYMLSGAVLLVTLRDASSRGR